MFSHSSNKEVFGHSFYLPSEQDLQSRSFFSLCRRISIGIIGVPWWIKYLTQSWLGCYHETKRQGDHEWFWAELVQNIEEQVWNDHHVMVHEVLNKFLTFLSLWGYCVGNHCCTRERECWPQGIIIPNNLTTLKSFAGDANNFWIIRCHLPPLL